MSAPDDTGGIWPATTPASEAIWHRALWALTTTAAAICLAASFGVFE